MKNLFLFTVLLVNICFGAFSQTKSPYHAYIEVGGMVSSNGRTPFWLRANQFGTVPYSGSFGTIRAGVSGAILLTDTTGAYARKSPGRAWILSYGAEAVGNAGQEAQLLAPEYYVKLAHRQLQFVIGRQRQVTGLVDTLLTSGSYSWSGNALPIPKIQFGTKGFAPLGRRQWLAINAFIAHGWFANTDYMQRSFLHQKSVFFRVGKPSSALRGYAGINHNVQWGGHSDSLDYHYAVNGQLPDQLSDFPNVLFAIRTNGLNNPRVTSFDYINLYGNHLGSIDFGLELRRPSVNFMLYHQHGFDDVTGVFFKNIPDGLSGLRIQPLNHGVSAFRVDDFLIEFLSTLNQSGLTFYQATTNTKGADNYFNNTQYKEGWAYKDKVLGTPFITLKQDAKANYQNTTAWRINNNRVQVAHMAMRATVANRMKLMAKLSYSRNYGVPQEPLSGTPVQWSSLVQLGMPLAWVDGMSLTGAFAADFGQLYTNTIGGYVGLRKVIW